MKKKLRSSLVLASAALVAIAALLAAMPRAAADDHPRTNRKIQTNGGDFESRRLQQKRGNDDIQRRVRGNNVFDRSSPDQSKKKRHRRKRRSKKAKTRKKDKKRDRKITKSSLSSSPSESSGPKGRDGQCQTMTIYRRKEDLIEGVTYFGDLTDGEPGDNVIITIPFYNSEVGGEDAMGDIVQDWTWNVNGDGIGDMVFNFNSASGGGQVFTSFTLDCTAGGSTNPITGGT